MPTARPTLDAAPREITGKKVALMRRAGRLPAVIYGHGVTSESVSLDAHEFDVLRLGVAGHCQIGLPGSFEVTHCHHIVRAQSLEAAPQ